MGSDDKRIKPGDRVVYPQITKFQLGAERELEEGVALDVITGEAGVGQIVFSKPDNDDLHSAGLRVDFFTTETHEPMVRKL